MPSQTSILNDNFLKAQSPFFGVNIRRTSDIESAISRNSDKHRLVSSEQGNRLKKTLIGHSQCKNGTTVS